MSNITKKRQLLLINPLSNIFECNFLLENSNKSLHLTYIVLDGIFLSIICSNNSSFISAKKRSS